MGYAIPPSAYDEGGYEAGVKFCASEASLRRDDRWGRELKVELSDDL